MVEVVMRLFSRLVNIARQLLAIFNRLLCFMHLTRRRKNSGTVLPMHADVQVLASVGEIQTSLPSNDVELESWDAWGADGGSSDFMHKSSVGDPNLVANSRHSLSSRYALKKSLEPEPEQEVDYFQELNLEPSIRKTKKVIIKKKDDFGPYSGLSSRLVMSSDIAYSPGNELGILDDMENVGWADEANEDLSGEAENALRDKRRLERERKLAEHQMKKLEKMGVRKDRSITVKLS